MVVIDAALVVRPTSRHAAGKVGPRVVVVEDDKALARLVQRKLRKLNFSVECVASAPEARAAFDRLQPDLVVLDLDLVDSTSWELLAEIRSRSSTPVLTVSMLRAEHNAVAALDMGADDYILKPFGLDELIARIRVALRHVARPSIGAQPILRVGNLELDLERHIVLRDTQQIHVTPTEFRLLKALVTQPDRFLSDRYLMDAVWGSDWRGGEHILHVYVARLRKKIEDDPSAPRYLLNESGLGYRFCPADSSPAPVGHPRLLDFIHAADSWGGAAGDSAWSASLRLRQS
jgi:two-component system KDP operon response regulator KdpE